MLLSGNTTLASHGYSINSPEYAMVEYAHFSALVPHGDPASSSDKDVKSTSSETSRRSWDCIKDELSELLVTYLIVSFNPLSNLDLRSVL